MGEIREHGSRRKLNLEMRRERSRPREENCRKLGARYTKREEINLLQRGERRQGGTSSWERTGDKRGTTMRSNMR